MSKPLLSIGIIFKNEIRCLERCLKSLRPLREAVPCELVMADTGSGDGSREVAERYADILFDFPWINDFAAARNAVMDRCSGKWYLTVDADEWLDEDISQLTGFLTDDKRKEICCTLIQRNYSTHDSAGHYSDFLAGRMIRLSTGARYTGSIHEAFNINIAPRSLCALDRTVLHHDGYVGLSSKEGESKRKRNMSLLREELKKSPDDLRRRLQCLESSAGDPDQETYVRLAVEGVRKKLPAWEVYGPAIFRSAVIWATSYGTDEVETFVEEARALFPDSISTRIDIEQMACGSFCQKRQYDKAISAGEAYMRAIEDYHAGRCDLTDMMRSGVSSISPIIENNTALLLAESYFQTGDYQKSVKYLTAAEFDKLRFVDYKNCIGVMINLQAQSGLELSGHMLKLWDYLEALEETDLTKQQRTDTLFALGGKVFPQKYRDAETEKGFRHAYTVFLPLCGKCEIGTAARILETSDAGELEELLHSVKNWVEFPIHALAHAMKRGVRFPLPDRPLNMEEMDGLAGRLAADRENYFPLLRRVLPEDPAADVQALLWTRSLSMAAVPAFDWLAEDADIDTGLFVVRSFARIEKEFLPFCYAMQVLKEENLYVLPPMHRFGWYCARAFDALDSGDGAGYVRLLRSGLGACKNVKDTVEFLLKHTPELQTRPEPTAELRALAEQIRAVLANFAPDDPAVAALKQSEAYQKVAHIIEGTDVPAAGELL